ncbi:MAG: carbohydrate kinase family protein [Erysipelotrichaceae bacterium]|nr:carbohydrate kinase family protein [Erysipelotrichaceae bacterium]
MNGYMTIIAGSDIDTYYKVESFLQEGDAGMAFPLGEKVGGCILNTGIIAANFGMDVKVLDYLREDDPGSDLLVRTMKENGLDTSYLRYGKDVENGRCLIMTIGKEKCIYVIPQKHPLYDMDDGKISSFLNHSGVIYSLVHVLYESFGKDIKPILDAKKNGALLALDGSSQYQDPDEVKTLALADHVFLNKQSYQRVSEAAGEEGKDYLLRNGVKTICVTDGSRGSTCYYPGGSIHEEAVKIPEVIDSTGAGDSFAAAFLTWHLSGSSLQESLKMASYAGAHKCLYEGALGALCTKEELEAFARQYE